jgi:glycosyltransferase involved in cell wall biosynthesis
VSDAAVSVALATFNGEQFLAEQLASLANQSSLPLELIVYDDASVDGTLRVLDGFARDAPFPVHVQQNAERLGFADTFLRAVSLCRGEWIAFCDQDDVWLDMKLQRCAAELNDDVLLVIHASRVVDTHLRPTGRMYPDVTRDRLEPPLHGDPWLAVRGMSMVFAKELLLAADPRTRPRSHYAEGLMHHDEWVYVLARGLGTTSFVREPLALYRQHSANVTGAGPGLQEGLRNLSTVGATYYGRRRDQAVQLAGVFDEIARDQLHRRDRAAEAARWYRDQAARLERRLAVYDGSVSATTRLKRLLHLARTGGYGARSKGGFGMRAFARDAAMLVLRRTG